MTILVTGGKGLLATEIKKKSKGMDILFCDIDEMDITDIKSIQTYIKKHRNITAIINCAAGRDAEILEENPQLAHQIAVDGPKNLSEIVNELDIPLIHISSDYVFDGKKAYPYTEEDKTNGLSIYGITKAEGEQVALKTANTVIIFRTAWLLSIEGKKSFVNTIANLAGSRSELGIVFDQIGSPTYAPDLAEMILNILPKIKKNTKEIYHLTNEGVCSWYDIAVTIVSELGLNCHIKPIHSWEYPTKAKRPSYSVLDKTKVKKDFGIHIRHYQEGLKECIQQLKNR